MHEWQTKLKIRAWNPTGTMLTYPYIFLGLDASSSLELLNHLNLVAESGRLVILTIHQPRLEIFHLFHKILFLCDGQVKMTRDFLITLLLCFFVS